MKLLVMSKHGTQGWLFPSSQAIVPFRLARPKTVQEALAAFAADADGAVFYAGGTDLVLRFREGLRVSTLVYLNGIEALRRIEEKDGRIVIWACVTHDAGANHPVLQAHVPEFAAAWRQIASPRVRFSASIGGNIMSRQPGYELSGMLEVLDARLHLISRTGTRTVSPAELWTGNAVPGELLTHIEIPVVSGARVRFAYDRHLRPTLQLALGICTAGSYLAGRAVIGAEGTDPQAIALDLADCTSFASLAEIADRAVEQALAGRAILPSTLPQAEYVRVVSAALLRRMLVGMAARE